jgi:hypothetical protein
LRRRPYCRFHLLRPCFWLVYAHRLAGTSVIYRRPYSLTRACPRSLRSQNKFDRAALVGQHSGAGSECRALTGRRGAVIYTYRPMHAVRCTRFPPSA